MTIKIQQPELQALILERMQQGGFASVEDVLLAALKTSSLASRESKHGETRESTGADLVAAMQSSPYREIALEPSREGMPVRTVIF